MLKRLNSIRSLFTEGSVLIPDDVEILGGWRLNPGWILHDFGQVTKPLRTSVLHSPMRCWWYLLDGVDLMIKWEITCKLPKTGLTHLRRYTLSLSLLSPPPNTLYYMSLGCVTSIKPSYYLPYYHIYKYFVVFSSSLSTFYNVPLSVVLFYYPCWKIEVSVTI